MPELDIGKALKTLRKKNGMSQWTVAMASGLKPEYISRLETRRIKNPRIQTIFKLAKVFKIEPSEFLEYAQNKKS